MNMYTVYEYEYEYEHDYEHEYEHEYEYVQQLLDGSAIKKTTY
jgi:hypothetical protein